MLALSVKKAFNTYQRGEHITDADEIAKIRASDNAGNVVAMNLPDSEFPPKSARSKPVTAAE